MINYELRDKLTDIIPMLQINDCSTYDFYNDSIDINVFNKYDILITITIAVINNKYDITIINNDNDDEMYFYNTNKLSTAVNKINLTLQSIK